MIFSFHVHPLRLRFGKREESLGEARMSDAFIVGVDIGGTFTDCVVVGDQGAMSFGKASSTPQNFAEGVLDAVDAAAKNLGMSEAKDVLAQTRLFYHACTIGDNTLITRSGAKTGLIATKGFGDAILMMRGGATAGLPEAEANHSSALTKPEPFVPKSLIAEVEERIDFEGDVLVRLERDEVERAVGKLLSQGVEAIAVALLWSVSNPSHERKIGDYLRDNYPEIFVTLSSEVAPFQGEYERTATTVFNAYIGPKIGTYLRNLRGLLRENGFDREPLIMQAYGGVLDIDASTQKAVGTIESGPASGVVACQFTGKLAGIDNIVAADMGGTTFKVGVVRNGELERDYHPVFLRHHLLSPKIWVESIGAGGGSIAWVDPETGLLKVGPQGAGASPGPVCYRQGGTEPTVTDANLILGYLNPDYFLGGRIGLDVDGARRAIEEKIAGPLAMTATEAANAVYRIVNAQMSDLISTATIQRGHDPRGDTLFAFGGAGPAHASRFAAELGIKQVVIPATASVHSAVGLVSSDVVYEAGLSDRTQVPVPPQHLNKAFAPMVASIREDLHGAGFSDEDITILRSVDMRYRYQVHELNVPVPAGWADLTEVDLERLYDHFDLLYEETYGKGSAYRAAGKEIVTYRVIGSGALSKPTLVPAAGGNRDAAAARKGERAAFFTEFEEYVPVPIYDIGLMRPAMEISEPAIIETPITTIVINPGDRAQMDEFGNIRIAVGAVTTATMEAGHAAER
jgi:N-methylhydantoinase A